MDALMRRRQMMTAGGEPPAPAPVFYTYLKFDGTAYIDTDITPGGNDSYRVYLGDESVKASQTIFIVPASSYRIGVIYGSATTSIERNFSIYYGASSAVSTGKKLAFSYAKYGFFITPNGFGYGTTFNSFTKGNTGPSGPLVLGNNANHDASRLYTGTMGTFYIYGSDAQNCQTNSAFDNYTPTHTLRPCTYNGEAGLWCVETSTFYGNSAGAGTLSVSN